MAKQQLGDQQDKVDVDFIEDLRMHGGRLKPQVVVNAIYSTYLR